MSKRSEEKKKQEYYRKRIGEKLEEAYLSIPMGDPPSEETIKKWIEIADKRRARKARRKRILLSSAAAVVLCVGLCATCILQTPEAVAGNSGGVKVETGIESRDTYKSNNDVPQNIQKLFFMFPENFEGFVIEDITITQASNVKKMEVTYFNEEKSEIYIEQTKVNEDEFLANVLSEDTIKETWNGEEVYINSYMTGNQETSYKLIKDDIFIKINVGPDLEKDGVKKLIQMAVRS